MQKCCEWHVSVLPKESIEWLNLKWKSVFIDATLWLWWHSKLVLDEYPDITVYWIDQDETNLSKARELLEKENKKRIFFIKDNFANIKKIAEQYNLIWKVDWILFDLWISSVHLDDAKRWFSFHEDWILDMRMDIDDNFLTAETVVNSYSEFDLMKIFFKYWEEPCSRKIAKAICVARKQKRIRTTLELVDIIKSAKKDRYKHPARLVFQALRIEVNKELEILKQSILDAIDILKIWWRIVIISFHSLEDKIVKEALKLANSDCICSKILPICQCKKIKAIEIINKKPIIPNVSEIEVNSRSRSAKMRIWEKV